MAELAEFLASFALSQADKDAARKQALMMAGLGLLGAKKGREGEAMGRAGLLGLDAYQQGLTGAKQSKIDEYKLKQAWTQQQEADKQKAAMNAARQAGVVPAQRPMVQMDDSGYRMPDVAPASYDYRKYAQALAPIDPMAALGVEEKLRPKPQDSPYAKIDPKDYTPDSIAAYASSGNPAVLRRYEAPQAPKSPVGNVSPGDFTPASVQKFLTTNNYADLVPIDKTPRTTVNVHNPYETAFSKKLGEQNAEGYVAINTRGSKAASKLNDLAVIEGLVGNVDTNALTPIGMKAAGVLKAFGIDADPTLPAKQAADAISNKMALESRSTGEGGGMPGAMSDQDREFLKNMNPNLAQTREGRKTLIEVQRRLAKREQQVAALAREYKKRSGTFDESFYDALGAWSAKNPLFQDLPGAAGAGAAAPATPSRQWTFNPKTGRLE